jgi:UDP-glucose 4-epimerase
VSHYLVTGGAGFIGSWLVERLTSQGNRVTVLDDFSAGRTENLQSCPYHLLEVVRTSTSDVPAVERAVAESVGVFHLASPVGVMRVLDDPKGTLDSIVSGGAVVSAACAKYNVPLLVASSSEIYGPSPPIPTPETAPAVILSSEPRWHYAAAKLIVEHQAMASGCGAIVVRLFNVVGPRQTGRYGMVVPRFVQQALSGRPITVFGDGNQTRSFMHVREAAEALHKLMYSPRACGETVNVGSDCPVSINNLAELVRRLVALHVPRDDSWAGDSIIEHVDQETAYGHEFHDVEWRCPNVSKLKALTGLKPSRLLGDVVLDVMEEKQGGKPGE